MGTELAKALAAGDFSVLAAEERTQAVAKLQEDVHLRLREANRRDSAEFAKVKSKADWEQLRDVRIKALRASLAPFPGVPKPLPQPLRVEVAKELDGEGFCIQNLVFESRPGLLVTANLYLPRPAREKMPGILLCHSHHNPKTEGELQDMGVNWARQGCMVLVMDQLGHGERRQQPFGGRQDYRSRFYIGMQFHLAGESLIGWMAWDLSCGVSLLLSRPGIDPERIIGIGSVAGGGDPMAVAVALDPRITCSVIFNFGGPQPETTFPLPANAEEAFSFSGSGSFESTRNLRLSARDGFFPYVIVAAAAPRYLVYAHEFAWDGERDPVWKRLQSIYDFYGAGDRVAAVHGWGNVKLRPPEASHCNNVGPAHRKELYPLLERWLGMPAPKEEKQQRRKPDELACLNDEIKAKFKPQPVHELLRALSVQRGGESRAALARLGPAERLQKLRGDWARLLGEIAPQADPVVRVLDKKDVAGVAVERFVLQVGKDTCVPALLLMPGGGKQRVPLVVAIAEEGKQAFLKQRAAEVAALLGKGVAVCVPDLRATGETGLGDDPGRFRGTTDISSTELMLGQTMLGSRLRDLRAVLRYLRTRGELDATRLALWGDSVSPVNTAPFEDVPETSDKWPHDARPLGGLLALFGALFEDDVRAVLVRRGLVGFEAVLHSHFCYVPHDCIVPGALCAGDLCDVAAALAPRALRFESLVDGRNCVVEEAELRRALQPALQAYAGHAERLVLRPTVTEEAGAWLAEQVNR